MDVLKVASRSRPNSVKKSGDEPIKVVPGFMEISIAGDEKTGIRFIIDK